MDSRSLRLSLDSCSTFVPERFCENIHVSNRQRTAGRSRYYADLWPCVSAFAAEYFCNLLFPVCDAAENSIDHLPFNLSDFEDAVMTESAIREEMDCIVTRNLGDYKKAALPVYSPEVF